MVEPAGTATDRRFSLLSAFLVLAVFAVLVSLGTWQVNRLVWKENLLATIVERMQGEPLPLDEVIAIKVAGGDIEYRRVTLTGHFLHEREQYFFTTLNGRSGYNVYTPFELGGGSLIFVNRGFVDIELRDRHKRRPGLLLGEVSITGLARDRLVDKPSMMVPDNDPAANIFYWKDIEGMAANAGIDGANADLVNFFVDADDTSNPGGWPIGGVTIVDLPNNHLQYAVTWYGLALALVGVTGFFMLRRKIRPGDEGQGLSGT